MEDVGQRHRAQKKKKIKKKIKIKKHFTPVHQEKEIQFAHCKTNHHKQYQ